jgi:serine/threonine-protein kinase HipA
MRLSSSRYATGAVVTQRSSISPSSARADIDVAVTRPIKLQAGVAIAIQRFDRLSGGLRRHALSANVALKAAGGEIAYPNLALLIRRKGVTEGQKCTRQMHELFR